MREEFLKRFLRYVAVPSQSDGKAGKVPSSEGQWDMARLLKGELEELGFQNLEISEYCVLTGVLPSNLPEGRKAPKIGWCAHMDTVDVGLSPEIHPHVVKNYQGGDICLNEEKQIFLRVKEHPEIERYKGDDIVVSDGTSVLGADDKSALANLLTVLDEVVREKRPHGDIYVAFVPDEEIGLVGSKHLDFSKFPVDYAYTIDSCELGELVWQSFNAGGGKLEIEGITAHPISSKGVLVNPTLVAVDFINMMNRGETPEFTEGTEGFVWVNGVVSSPSHATVTMKIRDHDKKKYESKKAMIRAAVDYLRVRYPKIKIDLTIEDVYANIADAMTDDNRAGLDNLYRAFEICEIEPNCIAMRGGTDGSYISTQGILTPNYFTGGLNFHSNCEFLPLGAAEKSMEVTKALIALAAGEIR